MKLSALPGLLRRSTRSPLFGFVEGHGHLSKGDLSRIEAVIGKVDQRIIRDFERLFAGLVGDGRAVSFAAGRMGFFALMKCLGIGSGHEVVLQGATCSVMVNAIRHCGATPVFADVDLETFGSSARSIETCLTPRTRMIVAQHSFGIPCEIKPIVELARSRGVFLLEDCALSLGSKLDGVVVGNFGDAALFSTDHSKPLNTLSGGLIYTRHAELTNKLLEVQEAAAELPTSKQRAMWGRLCLERRYCQPSLYGRMEIIDRREVLQSRLFRRASPFLDEDFRATAFSPSYPYPSRMPACLAAVGILEGRRWCQTVATRKKVLRGLLDVAHHGGMVHLLPKVYFDKRRDIVPLRFVWTQTNGADVRERLASFVHVSWTWFLTPIVGTDESMETFGYRTGTCPISERIGPGMVNLPCNSSEGDLLIERFRAATRPGPRGLPSLVGTIASPSSGFL